MRPIEFRIFSSRASPLTPRTKSNAEGGGVGFTDIFDADGVDAEADLATILVGLEVNIRNLNLIDMICSGDGRIWYCGE